MIRILHILGICALVAAGGVLALSVSLWRQDDPVLNEIRKRPSAVEVFRQSDGRGPDRAVEHPPLIVQAEAFARYLNPPQAPGRPPAPALLVGSGPAMPPIRPLAPSANFRLRGTSYYPNQPERSMALISEVGVAEGSERWVREGSQLGHFVIQEIRRGSITYRDGGNVREMMVEPVPSRPSLVRDLRPGSRQVSAAVDTNSIRVGGTGRETTAR